MTAGRGRRRALIITALVVLIVVGALAWRFAVLAPTGHGPHEARGAAIALREARRTLDPAQFTGKAARAYEVARAMPEVLDRLRCYCPCEPLGHTTLLSCYTDSHAAT